MIKILTSNFNSAIPPEDIQKMLEDKTIKTSKDLNLSSTVNMIDNHKDYYGYYKNEELIISRIRRLSFLRILPKLILIFPDTNTFKSYSLKLGTFTSLLFILTGLIIVSNLYEALSAGRFTNDFGSVSIFSFGLVLLLVMEIKIYQRKLNDIFKPN